MSDMRGPGRPPKRVIESRDAAVYILKDNNIPFDPKMSEQDLIKLAQTVPIEKWFKIELQEKNHSTHALVRVNGRRYQIQRGVDVAVPARVVEALKAATVFKYYQQDESTRILVQKQQEEVFAVLGETAPPKR